MESDHRDKLVMDIETARWAHLADPDNVFLWQVYMDAVEEYDREVRLLHEQLEKAEELMRIEFQKQDSRWGSF